MPHLRNREVKEDIPRRPQHMPSGPGRKGKAGQDKEKMIRPQERKELEASGRILSFPTLFPVGAAASYTLFHFEQCHVE